LVDDPSLGDSGAPPTASNAAQLAAPSYRLAITDVDFLLRDEMRPVRFQLEYAKADLLLRDWGVRSTIIVFGSARIPSPEQYAALKAQALTPEEVAYAEARGLQVGHYEAARAFGRIVSERGGAMDVRDGWRDNVVATGGGPGIMEAANRGAFEAGAPSIGYNVTLPTEQQPNPFSTPDLTFQFHYFAMRKMHLATRANALVAFPGGFGTLDELFEVLTLLQTRKAPPLPVLLFNQAYWESVISFEGMLKAGMIAPADLDLFCFAETAEEAWARLVERGVMEAKA
jgi:uncharacterized protein (TIGR00730 family)